MRLSDIKYLPWMLWWYYDTEYYMVELDAYVEREESQSHRCRVRTALKLLKCDVLRNVFSFAERPMPCRKEKKER